MPGKRKSRLQHEIKQTKAFASLEEEALLNLIRTANVVSIRFEEAIKPAGISDAQYNMLRILRGAGQEGITCSEAGSRMLTHDPDVTRLLDRLEARGLVARARSSRDRRIILTRITDEGLRVLAELDPLIARSHVQGLAHLGKARLRQLIRLLEAVREHK